MVDAEDSCPGAVEHREDEVVSETEGGGEDLRREDVVGLGIAEEVGDSEEDVVELRADEDVAVIEHEPRPKKYDYAGGPFLDGVMWSLNQGLGHISCSDLKCCV